jgi:hypothetical protein
MKIDTERKNKSLHKSCQVKWFWRHQNVAGGKEKWEMGSPINAKERDI